MGFDTYLLIDDEVALDWRKHASYMPRLLFDFDDRCIETDNDGEPTVEFCNTARDALRRLEEAGFGWSATAAAYAEIRNDTGMGYLTGLLKGRLAGDEVEYAKRQADFVALDPEADLRNLGEEIVRQWYDSECEEALFLSHLSFDGDLPNPTEAADALGRRQSHLPLSTLSAMRAAMAIAQLDRSAPLLSWPMVMCVVLQHLPPDSRITLDLSEDASQNLRFGDVSSAQEYAASYWEDSTSFLAGEARTMGRLWAVLASFDNKLGREFWFARAAESLSAIDAGGSETTKQQGDLLEDLFSALIKTEAPELEVIEKNLRTRESEIDLVLTNGLTEPFWTAMQSPLVLIECKNWSKPVGVDQLRVFETKMEDSGALCRVGIFVSMGGFTGPFLQRVRDFQRTNGVVFAVDGADLESIIQSRTRLSAWLKSSGLRRTLRGT